MAARRVVDQRFDGDQARVEVALSSMQGFRQTLEQTGIPALMTEAIIKQLQLASARGYAAKEMAQIVEVLWAHHRSTLPT